MATHGDGAARRDQTLDLQHLVHSVPSLIHTGNPDGYLDFFNRTWLRYVGRPLEDLQGWKWTAFIHREDVEGIVEKWRASLASGEPFLHEARVLRADSEYRWMLHHKVAVRDAGGQIVKWYGSSIDIEDRKQAEEQLRRSTEDLQRSESYLAEGQRLAHMGSWAFGTAGFDYWSPELFRMHGLDPAGKAPTVQVYLNCIHPQDRESMANLIEELAVSASPFDATKRIIRPDGEVRYIRCVGAPAVHSEGLKRYIGSAIDVTGHELVTQELRRREAYLAEAQRLSHTGSFGWKPDSGEIVWSEETYRIFEYDRAAKPTLDMVFQRIHPHDKALVQQFIEGVSPSADFEHECRLVTPGRAVKHIHVKGRALSDSSGNIEVVGAVTDITGRKNAEDKIRRLIDANLLGIFIGNVEGEIVEPNQAFLQMLQYSRQDLVPGRLRWIDLTPAEWRERDARAMAEVLETGVIRPYEKEFFRKDGSRVPVLIGSAMFPGANEGVVFVLDLSEQKRAHEALRKSESYLAQAQRLSQTGSFGCNLSTGEMYWSEETFRIYGYDRSTQPAIERVLERVHPEDRPLVQEHIDRASREGKDCDVECRLLLPDESVKYVRIVARASKTESGIEFIGAVTDITARKTSEDKIRRLVDAGILGIYFANLQGEIVEANQAFLQMLQYDRQDLTSGRLRWADLTPAGLHERDQRAVTEALANGFFQPYEKQFLRKDGGRVPVLLGGALFQGSNEGVAFALDLSEQKRAEEKIRAQEVEFRQILDLAPQLVAVYGPNRERLYANRVMLDYLGLGLEEWRTRLAFGGAIHPDDRERTTGHFDLSVPNGAGFELELRLSKRDGTYHWFLARCNPVGDHTGQARRWYIALTDIEERKRAEEILKQENVALREEIDKASMFEEIVGTSRPLKAVLSRIAKVAPTDSTVFITGETGTGKELVARAIHRRSSRGARAFVSVNCAALPPTLVASELFGHEKGAFTGATERRLGRFEMAEHGTIFLDEVGELMADTQAALLRVLQEREFERVGGGKPIHTDVRVITATNRDLSAALANGTFRRDLLYRLNVFPIEMPPLRERKDDILMLVEYFVQRYASRGGRIIRSIDQKTLDLLQSYDWPGNIRELQNVIERSIILSTTDVFSVEKSWLSRETSRPAVPVETATGLKSEGEPWSERENIEAALAETRGRVSGPSGAAVKLRIPPSTLESRIKALNIDKRRFKYG